VAMDFPARTATVNYMNHVEAGQLPVDLCLCLTDLNIDTVLFFVSNLPWFVELREVSLMSPIVVNRCMLTSLG